MYLFFSCSIKKSIIKSPSDLRLHLYHILYFHMYLGLSWIFFSLDLLNSLSYSWAMLLLLSRFSHEHTVLVKNSQYPLISGTARISCSFFFVCCPGFLYELQFNFFNFIKNLVVIFIRIVFIYKLA